MNKQSSQYYFAFGNKCNYQYEDFIVSDSNNKAHQFILVWPNWGNQKFSKITFLEGPQFSGKSHLANIWQKISHARFINKNDIVSERFTDLLATRQSFIIDNVENFLEAERNLFHLLNIIIEEKKFLLITSTLPPNKINVCLPDLHSRFLACNHISIKEPDNDLMKGILVKLLTDRQLRISIEALNFLVNYVERSYNHVNKIVSIIDKKSLEQKRNITIPFLKEIIGQ